MSMTCAALWPLGVFRSAMIATVPVSDLRVGMFVHLDLGWMRHPFALSSFRISSPDQIETIRGLGLQQVRWVPEKSDEPVAQAPVAAVAGLDPTEAQAQARRATLAAQRAATAHLERQCAEAGQALREVGRQARAQPVQAREDTEALSRKLVDQMLVDGELCIRLMHTQTGDRAAAHGLNVAVIALLMGRSVGLAEAEMMDLGVGSMLHDVGKLELPDRVRHVDESFTSAETNAYRDHVAQGVQLGRRMGLSGGALTVLAQHHEHADGSGFPLRLGADRMSTAARIVAIVNRYDNLCNPAVPARALTPHEAVSLLFAQSRNRFDATLLNTFIRMMGVYPAGSLVQLTDDRFAMVMAVNSSRPLKPRVLVHDPRVPADEAMFLDLEHQPQLGIRRSLAPAKLPPAALDYLAPRPRVAYFFEPLRPAEPAR
jgi:HD-GYP domain-containing protein (c-di-GMP phosphodiesterase class II)